MKNRTDKEVAELLSVFTSIKVPVYRVTEYFKGNKGLLKEWIKDNRAPGVIYTPKEIIIKICDNP